MYCMRSYFIRCIFIPSFKSAGPKVITLSLQLCILRAWCVVGIMQLETIQAAACCIYLYLISQTKVCSKATHYLLTQGPFAWSKLNHPEKSSQMDHILSNTSLTQVSQLPNNYLCIHYLPINYLSTTYQLPINCLSSTYQVPIKYLSRTYQLPIH